MRRQNEGTISILAQIWKFSFLFYVGQYKGHLGGHKDFKISDRHHRTRLQNYVKTEVKF